MDDSPEPSSNPERGPTAPSRALLRAQRLAHARRVLAGTADPISPVALAKVLLRYVLDEVELGRRSSEKGS